MEVFNIDQSRKERLGFPEIIYGASKTVKALLAILNNYVENGTNAMVTKLQPEKAELLLAKYSDAFYDEVSEVFLLEINEDQLEDAPIAVVAAGTSDLFVLNEAFYTLAYLGVKADRIIDIGVAGLHRLLSRLEELRKYKVLIVIAGFEGALPTVMGGLLPQPIIAVPTSVGYGVAAEGQAALRTMLASCANGISVVNVDNGYGAAMAAYRILNLVRG